MSRIMQMTSPVAVVSGAGSGIGAACADRLAAVGFAVILVGRRPQALEGTAAAIRKATASARVTCLPGDVSEPDDVRALAERIGADFEFVDVIVNNAGAPAVSHSDDLADLAAAWLQTYRANTLTAVLLTTALEPLLRSPGGRVILIGSKSARAGNASPAYGTAKAALSGYLAATAARLGPRASRSTSFPRVMSRTPSSCRGVCRRTARPASSPGSRSAGLGSRRRSLLRWHSLPAQMLDSSRVRS